MPVLDFTVDGSSDTIFDNFADFKENPAGFLRFNKEIAESSLSGAVAGAVFPLLVAGGMSLLSSTFNVSAEALTAATIYAAGVGRMIAIYTDGKLENTTASLGGQTDYSAGNYTTQSFWHEVRYGEKLVPSKFSSLTTAFCKSAVNTVANVVVCAAMLYSAGLALGGQFGNAASIFFLAAVANAPFVAGAGHAVGMAVSPLAHGTVGVAKDLFTAMFGRNGRIEPKQTNNVSQPAMVLS